MAVREIPWFYGRLKETCSNRLFGGANVGKENRKTLAESTLRGFYVPGAEAPLLLYIEA